MTDDDSASMVEWGSTAAETAVERVNGRRWWPARGETKAAGAGPATRTHGFRISPIGLGCAIVGFGLTLAAELLPWMTVRLGSARDPSTGEFLPDQSGSGVDLGLDRLASWQSLLYNGGWIVLFALIAVALVADPRRRRTAIAAGLGAAAGQVTLLVGIAHAVNDGVGIYGDGLTRLSGPPVQFGPGLYAAFGAVLVVAAALVFAGRVRGSRPGSAAVTAADQPTEPAGPVDLTVTPVEPYRDGISR
jgi:hypothetical protein